MRHTHRWERPPSRHPQFLRIRWEATNEDTGDVVTLEATLCLPHRREIALNSSARSVGRAGDACDLCDGRPPSRDATKPDAAP
jgi:hypothetical protein